MTGPIWSATHFDSDADEGWKEGLDLYKISNPLDWLLKGSYRFAIWRTALQQCNQEACQLPDRLEYSKHNALEARHSTRSYDKTYLFYWCIPTNRQHQYELLPYQSFPSFIKWSILYHSNHAWQWRGQVKYFLIIKYIQHTQYNCPWSVGDTESKGINIRDSWPGLPELFWHQHQGSINLHLFYMCICIPHHKILRIQIKQKFALFSNRIFFRVAVWITNTQGASTGPHAVPMYAYQNQSNLSNPAPRALSWNQCSRHIATSMGPVTVCTDANSLTWNWHPLKLPLNEA